MKRSLSWSLLRSWFRCDLPLPLHGAERRITDEEIWLKYNYWITSHVCIVTRIVPISKEHVIFKVTDSQTGYFWVDIEMEIKAGKNSYINIWRPTLKCCTVHLYCAKHLKLKVDTNMRWNKAVLICFLPRVSLNVFRSFRRRQLKSNAFQWSRSFRLLFIFLRNSKWDSVLAGLLRNYVGERSLK